MTDPLHPNRRILLIDDNPAIHEDFQKILANDSATASGLDADVAAFFEETNPASILKTVFELDSAVQGEEGFSKAVQAQSSRQPYALAFVDMRMPPGWDGLETIRRIWEVCPDLETVICTAYSDHSWQEIQQALGASDRLLILKKPFDKVEVQQLALALTEKWNLRRLARMQMEGLEEMARLRTRELVRTIQLKSEFMANISHELLTPMNGILGNSDLLGETALSKDQRELLSDVQESGKRLQSLIQGVFKFNTIESGGLKLQSIPFNARELCQSAINAHAAKAQTKGLELKFILDANVPIHQQGDPEQMQQILSLLLENALKFTGRGSVTLRVQAAQQLGAVEFAVLDTGIGIASDRLGILTQPFVQADGSLTRNEQGVGLGLTLVHQLLRMMGTQLEIQSQPGVGSSFFFVLPAANHSAKAA